MTNDTETTSDDMTDNDETTNPLDLLPVGDTDVFAETAEIDDDTDHGTDVAEEVEAMHIETGADDAASDDEVETTDDDVDVEVEADDEVEVDDELELDEQVDARRDGAGRRSRRCAPVSGTWCTPSRATRRRSRPTSRPASSR